MRDPEFPFVNIEPLFPDLWVAEELGSNIYFLRGTEKILVIDTAYGLTDLNALAKKLCGDLPLMCVNSHEHPDHNAGNSQFPRVGVGQLGEPASHAPANKEHLISFLGHRLDGMPFDADAWNPGPAPVIDPLFEGDVIDLGGTRLTVIETPGHSAGSIALLDEATGRLFTGDTALTWEVWGQLPTSLCLRGYLRSLEKLAAIEKRVSCVLPGHSGQGSGTSRFTLPPRILSVYADGTRAIVEGHVAGRDYAERQPRFRGMRYADFEIGGMAWDPSRV